MHESRRSFLKRVGYAAVGAGCSAPLLGAASRVLEESLSDAGSGGRQWGMVIDEARLREDPGLRRQVHRACTEACHTAHNVPQITNDQGNLIPEEEVKWIWEENYQNAFPDQAHHYTPDSLQAAPVLVLCNHCTSPPCVKVCPTKATWKRKSDGVVMMDMHRCIGCRYCIAACPYGSRSFNWRDPREKTDDGKFRHFNNSQKLPSVFPTRTKGVVEKCNLCAERIRQWQTRIEQQPERIQREPEPVPACVEAAKAIAGAEQVLTFGDLSDPDSDVSKLLAQKRTICRRFSLGTGPNVFYIV